MERYGSYKDSGVEWIGEIPSHWNVKRLQWISNIENSGVWGEDDPFEGANEVPIPTTAQLSIEGRWDYDGMAVRYLSDEEKDKYLCRVGDIIVVKSSGSATNIITGKCGYIGEGDNRKFGFSNFLLRVRTNEKFHSRLTYFFLQSNLTKQRIERMVSATTYPNLKVDEYVKSELTVPPLHEQEQIVEYLDRKTTLIDSLIEKTVRKIELLKEKRTSLINEVVTKGLNPDVEMKDSGVEWIGECPSHWDIKKVKHLIVDKGGIKIGPFGSALKLDTLTEQGIKIYGQGNVIKGDFSVGNRYIPMERFLADFAQYEIFTGDILITMMGTTGKSAVFQEEYSRGILDSHLLRLRFKKSSFSSKLFVITLQESDYVFHQLKLNSKGSIMEGLNSSIVKEITLLTPPLQEQEQIVEFLDEQTSIIDSTITTEEKRIELLKEYRQSLISEVVTGKVKVTRDE